MTKQNHLNTHVSASNYTVLSLRKSYLVFF